MFKSKQRTKRLKCVVLDTGLDKEYRKAHRSLCLHDDPRPLDAFLSSYGYDVFEVARNIERARGQRTKRVRERIAPMVKESRAYFITFTFRDTALNNTSAQTRRRYVCRALKRVSTAYVANIDFGDKAKNPESNEREHYHAIVYSPERPAFPEWEAKRGFVKVKKIGSTDADMKKVAKYTAKLSNHALKASTGSGDPKAPRLIYSRNCLDALRSTLEELTGTGEVDIVKATPPQC